MSELQRTWNRLKAVLKLHDPIRLAGLRSPATPQAIVELERAIGLQLPLDYRESMKLHDGELEFFDECSPREKGIILEPSSRLYPLEAVSLERKRMLEIDDDNIETVTVGSARIKQPNRIICEKWLPFAQSETAFYILDLDPNSTGTFGQVLLGGRYVDRTRGTYIYHFDLEAESFTTWLKDRMQEFDQFYA
jgi:cell wall assembly regulator SMI1